MGRDSSARDDPVRGSSRFESCLSDRSRLRHNTCVKGWGIPFFSAPEETAGVAEGEGVGGERELYPVVREETRELYIKRIRPTAQLVSISVSRLATLWVKGGADRERQRVTSPRRYTPPYSGLCKGM